MLFNTTKLVLIVTLSAFVAVALLDSSDKILHLKLPLFILAFSVWIIRTTCGMASPCGYKIWVAILLFAFVLPGIATFIGLLGDTLPVDEVHFATLKSFATILLIPIIASEGIDLTKHIIRWSIIIAILTIAMAVLSLVAPLFSSVVYEYTLEKGNAFISSRDTLSLGIGSFYYSTVSVLVFPIAYYLRNLLDYPKKAISFALIFIYLAAVLCSGSRATALGSFIVVSVLVLQKLRTNFGPRTALLVLFVILVLGGGYVSSFFNADEPSNAAKLGHARSYVEEFGAHPLYLVWGQGADTKFYSGVGTELSYVELVRQFGIPVTSIILIALFYPVFGLARRERSVSYLTIPYGVFLFEAGTNPLLVGSTGFMVVSAIWGVLLMRTVNKTIAFPAEVLS